MSYLVTSDYALNQVTAPRLPAAPVQYDSQYIEQYSNTLRLYFNQLNNILGQLVANTTLGTSTNPLFTITDNESPYALPAYLQASRGLVSGVTPFNMFGYQSAIGTTFIPVWENTTTYTYPVSAQTMYLWSTSSSDTSVQILVNGLDSSYNLQSETVTLNGTTVVATTKQYLRINGLSVTGGVNPTSASVINIGNSTKTIQYAEIAAGAGRSQMAIYTVPNGYTMYLTRVSVTSNQVGNISSSYCTYRVFSVSSSGIQTIVLETPFTNSFSATRVVPFAYPAKTDIQVQANTPSSTAAVGVQWEGLLIATGTP